MPALSIAATNTFVTPRSSARRSMILPGRVTWKDARGTTRFASVVTRDVSDTGIFIEWRESTSIPLYRLVTFQLERDARHIDGLPPALRAGKVLSAVYRAGEFRKATGTPEGYGLRLLVDPIVRAGSAAPHAVEATA
jgi:hypothetical protein